MMRVHYLQHVPFEDLGSIGPWIAQRGIDVTSTHLYRDEVLPSADHIDWLIVLGGPMSVHDEPAHPWLVPEKRFIGQVIEQEKTVLGICLGAQLIANVLGANVWSNAEREIGWFPIERIDCATPSETELLLPPNIDVFHWHGETFDLPSGTTHLARSEACENQAFGYGDRILGLQFHLETTPAAATRLIENCGDELTEGRYVEDPAAMVSCIERFDRINGVMGHVLDHMRRWTGHD